MADAPSDVHVWAECPGCGAVWLAARVTAGTWWAPSDPLTCLRSPWCPSCERAPPMLDAQRRGTDHKDHAHGRMTPQDGHDERSAESQQTPV